MYKDRFFSKLYINKVGMLMMIICDEEKNIVMKDDSFIECFVEFFFKSFV